MVSQEQPLEAFSYLFHPSCSSKQPVLGLTAVSSLPLPSFLHLGTGSDMEISINHARVLVPV